MKNKCKFWNKYTKIGAMIGFVIAIYPYVLFFLTPFSKIIVSMVSNSLTTVLLTLWGNIPGFRCGSDGCEGGFFLVIFFVPLLITGLGALIGFLVYKFKNKKDE
ncbi:MAG: hypothetical protein AABX04_01230 [Nanoarchaeota archaeon]